MPVRVTLKSGEDHVGAVSGHTAVVTARASITRPADTTAYASGDLVAHSTDAGLVEPFVFAVGRLPGGSGMVRRVRLVKTDVATANASFRLHLYAAIPRVANGDNGAWSSDGAANYLGSLDVSTDRAFTDGAAGQGDPTNGAEINFVLAEGQRVLYGLLEARGAYTPGSAEKFTPTLECLLN